LADAKDESSGRQQPQPPKWKRMNVSAAQKMVFKDFGYRLEVK
jgi:hypothetical protein